MFKKVLYYAGEYRRLTYQAVAALLAGIVMSVIPYFFIYQLLRPILTHETVTAGYVLVRVGAMAVCAVFYAVFYVKGLSLSHEAAYHTLENLRIALQGRLEKLPLGVIEEKGTGALKKCLLTISSPSRPSWPMRCRRASPTWQCPF